MSSNIGLRTHKEFVAEAKIIGAKILDIARYPKAADLFAALERPIRVGKNYELLFDCWASHTLEPNYAIEEQSGKVVSLTDLTNSKEMIELCNDFAQYTRVFGIDTWSNSRIINSIARLLPVVNTFKFLIDNISSISASEFQATTGVDPTRLCEHLTGDKNDITNSLWTYHFTGLIDRIRNPGSKLDSMLILISKQKGWNKTIFLETLAGNISNNYVSLIAEDLPNPFIHRKIKGRAIVNFDNCDVALQSNYINLTKAFITNRVDLFQGTHDFITVAQERTNAFFATSNNTDLVKNLEGDRRFYPVLLTKPVDVQWLEANYQIFFGYYKWLLESGGNTYPTQEEIEYLAEDTQAVFKAENPSFETIRNFVSSISKSGYCFSTADFISSFSGGLNTTDSYTSLDIEYLLTYFGFRLTREVLSTGITPVNPLWSNSFGRKPISRTELQLSYNNFISPLR